MEPTQPLPPPGPFAGRIPIQDDELLPWPTFVTRTTLKELLDREPAAKPAS